MPNWDTNTRGQNRKSENSYYDEQDYDGLSDCDPAGIWLGPQNLEDWESVGF